MKQLFLFLLLCSLGFSQYNTPINFELLEERDGLYYQYNSPKPFSGKVFNIEGLSEGSFRNGKKSGKFSFYYDNGQLKSQGYYSNNLQQRKWTYYFENGQLNGTGSYRDGDGTDLGSTGVPRNGRIGKWKFYHENGQLKEDFTYKNGKNDGTWKFYYENGQLRYEQTYKDGKPYGPYKSYFENGQLEWEFYYNTLGDIDDTKLVKRWYENGQLYQVGFVEESSNYWKTRKTYSEEGKLLKEETFKDGDVIESKEY